MIIRNEKTGHSDMLEYSSNGIDAAWKLRQEVLANPNSTIDSHTDATELLKQNEPLSKLDYRKRLPWNMASSETSMNSENVLETHMRAEKTASFPLSHEEDKPVTVRRDRAGEELKLSTHSSDSVEGSSSALPPQSTSSRQTVPRSRNSEMVPPGFPYRRKSSVESNSPVYSETPTVAKVEKPKNPGLLEHTLLPYRIPSLDFDELTKAPAKPALSGQVSHASAQLGADHPLGIRREASAGYSGLRVHSSSFDDLLRQLQSQMPGHGQCAQIPDSCGFSLNPALGEPLDHSAVLYANSKDSRSSGQRNDSSLQRSQKAKGTKNSAKRNLDDYALDPSANSAGFALLELSRGLKRKEEEQLLQRGLP